MGEGGWAGLLQALCQRHPRRDKTNEGEERRQAAVCACDSC